MKFLQKLWGIMTRSKETLYSPTFVIAMEAFDSLLLESQVKVLFWVSSLGERGGSEEISPLLFVDDY